jgi:ADP-ribose pyrophosphatase YjhB (NUDIX family)
MTQVLATLWKSLHLPTSWQLAIMRRVQDQFLIGVTGIIFNDKDEVLLFRHTYRKRQWSLPGGYIKAREHPKEGIEREIEEESGLIVSADWRYKIRTDRDSARLDIVYVGSFMGGEFKASKEVTEAKFFRFDTLPRISKDQLVLLERIMQQRTNE